MEWAEIAEQKLEEETKKENELNRDRLVYSAKESEMKHRPKGIIPNKLRINANSTYRHGGVAVQDSGNAS